MTARRRSILALLAVIATGAALTACASDPGPAPTSSETAAVPSAPPSAAPEPTATATAPVEATCESILPAETVADFQEIGWTFQEEPFHVGALELADGIQCTWGDFSVASDHVQIFGWAPIDTVSESRALDELVSSGWTREDSADGIYVTESPESVLATDAEGYGFTYLFGDGWVTTADTKQGLLLIEPPQG